MSDCEIDYQMDDEEPDEELLAQQLKLNRTRYFAKKAQKAAQAAATSAGGNGKGRGRQGNTDSGDGEQEEIMQIGRKRRGRGRGRGAVKGMSEFGDFGNDPGLQDEEEANTYEMFKGPGKRRAKGGEEGSYPELGADVADFDQKLSMGEGREKKIFWRKYWRQKKEEKAEMAANQKMGRAQFYASRGKIRTPWKPSDNYRLHDIRPIYKQKVYNTNMPDEEGDDLIVQSFDERVVQKRRRREKVDELQLGAPANFANMQQKGDMLESQTSIRSSSSINPSTVTFSNTAAFGKLLNSNDRWHRGKKVTEDDPNVVKYLKGFGSVKGLHYRKYIGIEMLSENNFALTFHKFYSNEIKNLIRSIQNSRFSPEMRTWVLSILNYEQLMTELKPICTVNQIHIEDIPQFTMNLMKTKVPYSLVPNPYFKESGPKHYGTFEEGKKWDYGNDRTIHLKLEEFLPPLIYKNLHTFQRDGVKKGLKFYGRIMINDDFGTGKSLQGLSLALAYRLEWPLIILCPNFAKFSWRYEILKWLPGFDIRRIQVLQNEKEELRPEASILIVTYDLAVKMTYRLQQLQLKVCIIDEAQWFGHGLTNMDRLPNYQKNVLKVVLAMKRVILLSSLNVMTKPALFHPLAKIIRPDIIPNFYEYGYRYCDPRQSFDGINFDFAGNLIELKQVLEKRFSSCSRRKHIYQDLPEVMFSKWEVTADVNIVIKIQHMLKTFIQPWEIDQLKKNPDTHKGFFYEMFFNHFSAEKIQENPELSKYLAQPIDEGTASFQKSLKQIFRDLFDLTGQSKLKAVFEIIDNLLFQSTYTRKVIICAYHTSFLTSIEDYIANRKAEFLYIGRNLSSEHAFNICKRFSQLPQYKALIMDSSSKFFSQNFFFLKDSFPYGLPIIMCETFWTIPKFVEPDLDMNEVQNNAMSEFDSTLNQSEQSILNNANHLEGDIATQEMCQFQNSQKSDYNSEVDDDEELKFDLDKIRQPSSIAPANYQPNLKRMQDARFDRINNTIDNKKIALSSFSSILPDHSNLIFIYGRYTLDELIFQALYEQDRLFFDALEPLQPKSTSSNIFNYLLIQPDPPQQSQTQIQNPETQTSTPHHMHQTTSSKSGSTFLCLNYDEIAPQNLQLNSTNRHIILQYQRHQISSDHHPGNPGNPSSSLSDSNPTTTDAQLIASFNPLTPTRHLLQNNPNNSSSSIQQSSSTLANSLKQLQSIEQQQQQQQAMGVSSIEDRTMPKINLQQNTNGGNVIQGDRQQQQQLLVQGNGVGVGDKKNQKGKKSETLDNMFNRQVLRQMQEEFDQAQLMQQQQMQVVEMDGGAEAEESHVEEDDDGMFGEIAKVHRESDAEELMDGIEMDELEELVLTDEKKKDKYWKGSSKGVCHFSQSSKVDDKKKDDVFDECSTDQLVQDQDNEEKINSQPNPSAPTSQIPENPVQQPQTQINFQKPKVCLLKPQPDPSQIKVQPFKPALGQREESIEDSSDDSNQDNQNLDGTQTQDPSNHHPPSYIRGDSSSSQEEYDEQGNTINQQKPRALSQYNQSAQEGNIQQSFDDDESDISDDSDDQSKHESKQNHNSTVPASISIFK